MLWSIQPLLEQMWQQDGVVRSRDRGTTYELLDGQLVDRALVNRADDLRCLTLHSLGPCLRWGVITLEGIQLASSSA